MQTSQKLLSYLLNTSEVNISLLRALHFSSPTTINSQHNRAIIWHKQETLWLLLFKSLIRRKVLDAGTVVFFFLKAPQEDVLYMQVTVYGLKLTDSPALAISICQQLVILQINTGLHLIATTAVIPTLILAGVQTLTAELTPG